MCAYLVQNFDKKCSRVINQVYHKLIMPNARHLQDVCELGIPERDVRFFLMQSQDARGQCGERLVDMLGFFKAVFSHTTTVDTFGSCQINEVQLPPCCNPAERRSPLFDVDGNTQWMMHAVTDTFVAGNKRGGGRLNCVIA